MKLLITNINFVTVQCYNIIKVFTLLKRAQINLPYVKQNTAGSFFKHEVATSWKTVVLSVITPCYLAWGLEAYRFHLQARLHISVKKS
jgi:hypothetical protein